jgi:hypothetical protein
MIGIKLGSLNSGACGKMVKINAHSVKNRSALQRWILASFTDSSIPAMVRMSLSSSN